MTKCKACGMKVNIGHPYGWAGKGRAAHMCREENIARHKTMKREAQEVFAKAVEMTLAKKKAMKKEVQSEKSNGKGRSKALS